MLLRNAHNGRALDAPCPSGVFASLRNAGSSKLYAFLSVWQRGSCPVRSSASDELDDLDLGAADNGRFLPMAFADNRLIQFDGNAFGGQFEPFEQGCDRQIGGDLPRFSVYKDI